MKQCIMDGFIMKQNFGQPIQAETTNGGATYIKFQFNSSDSKKKADGSWEKLNNYFDCIYWAKSQDDETIQAILNADGLMFLIANPVVDVWEKDGKKNSKVTMKVKSVFAKPKAESGFYDADCPF